MSWSEGWRGLPAELAADLFGRQMSGPASLLSKISALIIRWH